MTISKEQRAAGERLIRKAYARAARIKAKVEEAMAKQQAANPPAPTPPVKPGR